MSNVVSYEVQEMTPDGWRLVCRVERWSVAADEAMAVTAQGRDARVINVGRLDSEVVATFTAPFQHFQSSQGES